MTSRSVLTQTSHEPVLARLRSFGMFRHGQARATLNKTSRISWDFPRSQLLSIGQVREIHPVHKAKGDCTLAHREVAIVAFSTAQPDPVSRHSPTACPGAQGAWSRRVPRMLRPRCAAALVLVVGRHCHDGDLQSKSGSYLFTTAMTFSLPGGASSNSSCNLHPLQGSRCRPRPGCQAASCQRLRLTQLEVRMAAKLCKWAPPCPQMQK